MKLFPVFVIVLIIQLTIADAEDYDIADPVTPRHITNATRFLHTLMKIMRNSELGYSFEQYINTNQDFFNRLAYAWSKSKQHKYDSYNIAGTWSDDSNYNDYYIPAGANRPDILPSLFVLLGAHLLYYAFN